MSKKRGKIKQDKKQVVSSAARSIRPHFKVSVYNIETVKVGWDMIETDIPCFAIRDIVRDLYDEGYTDESILIETA